MTGEKYSHLDESQIGQIYVNDDNMDVIKRYKLLFNNGKLDGNNIEVVRTNIL